MNKRKRFLSGILTFAMIISLLAVAPVSAQAKSAKPKLAKSKATIEVGQTISLKVKNKPKGVKVTYKSSNKKIATVSKKGKVCGKNEGKATITISLKRKKTRKQKSYKKNLKFKVTVVSSGSDNNGDNQQPAEPGDNSGNDTTNPDQTNNPTPAVPGGSATGGSGFTGGGASGGFTGGGSSSGNGSGTGSSSGGTKTDTGSNEYTRGEWVHVLASKLNYKGDIDENSYNFVDSRDPDNEYAKDIELSYGFGIIPSKYIDEEEEGDYYFRPDNNLTKEYATYTVIKALGFIDEGQKLSCSDSGSLKYPSEDAIAVNQGIVSLDSGAFNPDEKVTKTAGNEMIDKMMAIIDSAKIDVNDQKADISYQKEVVTPDKVGSVSYDLEKTESGYTVTTDNIDSLAALQPGDVFVLPADANHVSQIALKVSEAPIRSGDRLVINCVAPELQDVVTNIDFQGEGKPIYGSIIPSEGVTATYGKSGTENEIKAKNSSRSGYMRSHYGKNIDVDQTFDTDLKTQFKLVDKKLTEHSKVTGTVDISIKSIALKMNADVGLTGVDLKSFAISEKDNVTFTGSITYDNASHNKDDDSSTLVLGTIPVALGETGLLINIQVIASWSVQGEITISYSADLTHGIQYINGTPRLIKDFTFTGDWSDLKISAHAQCGIGIRTTLDFLSTIHIAGIETTYGPALDIDIKVHSDENLTCADDDIYLVWDAKLTDDTILRTVIEKTAELLDEKVTLDWNIYTKKNTPLKISLHFENGVKVDECTYKKIYGDDTSLVDPDYNYIPEPITEDKDKKRIETEHEAYLEKYGLHRFMGDIYDYGGYINDDGKIIFDNSAYDLGEFHNGLAKAGVDIEYDENGITYIYHLYGFIDYTGKWIIEPKYDSAGDFLYDSTIVTDRTGKKTILLKKDGTEISLDKYKSVGQFTSEGVALVTDSDGMCGAIDTSGNEVIPCKYSSIHEYSDGLALAWRRGDTAIVYLDKSGKEVLVNDYTDFNTKLDAVMSFTEGLAPVTNRYRYNKEGREKCGYMDKNGKVVIDTVYDFTAPFHDGIAAVRKGDKEGFIDRTGKVVIPLTDERTYILDTYKESVWGSMDQQPSYVDTSKFHDGLHPFQDNATKKYGFINMRGDIVVPAKYDSVRSFNEGLAKIYVDNKGYGYIDKNGTEIVAPQYDSCDDYFSNGMARVEINGKYGYVNSSGKLVIPVEYDEVQKFENGLASVHKYIKPDEDNWRTEKGWYLLDKNGNVKFTLDYVYTDTERYNETKGKYVECSENRWFVEK